MSVNSHSPIRPSRLQVRAPLLWLAIGIGTICAGCSHLGLERRTILQGSTISDMQSREVLDNLAMFACNPNALAWHIKITGGVVQLADQGGAFAGANLGGPGVFAPNLALQRNVLGQWNVDPTIEADELELLQIAYSKAVNPLDPDGSIKQAAYQKICELASDYHIVLTHGVAADVIDTMTEHAVGKELERLRQLDYELEKLYAEIDELSLHPARYEPEKQVVSGVEVPTRLDFLKEEVVRLLHQACHNTVEQVRAYHRPGRNVGLVEQAQDKIEALVELFDEDPDGQPSPFSSPWICQGSKADVPPCACLVGCYKGCGCECCVWIRPEYAGLFRDFVLIVLALAPPNSQDAAPVPAGFGAANNANL